MITRFITAVIIAASALLPADAARAECLPSPEAVRAIHGQGAWSKWHTVKGQRCYFVGERPAAKHEARTPLPQPRPAALAAQDEIQILTTPSPASIQIADIAPNPPLREAMTEWLRGKYWVLMWRARN